MLHYLIKSGITFVLIALAIIAFEGCSDKSFIIATGMVIDSGEWEDGGCGLVVMTLPDSVEYEPFNLPDNFLLDNQPVSIDYEVLDRSPNCLQRSEIKGVMYIHKIESAL